jgi:hypothetical protein
MEKLIISYFPIQFLKETKTHQNSIKNHDNYHSVIKIFLLKIIVQH